MKILIASDHAGFPLKAELLKAPFKLPSGETVEFLDLGTHSTDSVDYPDFADKLCEKLLSENNGADLSKALGVLICGSGVGISMAANRFAGIRAVLAESEKVARLSREHNHANVLCMGANIISADLASKILTAFLTGVPDPGERHVRRIQKLSNRGVNRT